MVAWATHARKMKNQINEGGQWEARYDDAIAADPKFRATLPDGARIIQNWVAVGGSGCGEKKTKTGIRIDC
jgi:hypothetical protein